METDEGFLNETTTVKEITRAFRGCINNNNNRDKETEPTIVWDVTEAVMRGNLISKTSARIK